MPDYKGIKVVDDLDPRDLPEDRQLFNFEDYTVSVPTEAVEAYQDAINPELSLLHRIRRFLSAESKAGRKAKIIKDFGLIFVPYGRHINNITQLIGDLMASNEKQTSEAPQSKTPIKSKTLITMGVLFIAGLLQALGVLPDSVEIAKGQEWVAMVVALIGMAIRLIKGKDIRFKKQK